MFSKHYFKCQYNILARGVCITTLQVYIYIPACKIWLIYSDWYLYIFMIAKRLNIHSLFSLSASFIRMLSNESCLSQEWWAILVSNKLLRNNNHFVRVTSPWRANFWHVVARECKLFRHNFVWFYMRIYLQGDSTWTITDSSCEFAFRS